MLDFVHIKKKIVKISDLVCLLLVGTDQLDLSNIKYFKCKVILIFCPSISYKTKDFGPCKMIFLSSCVGDWMRWVDNQVLRIFFLF